MTALEKYIWERLYNPDFNYGEFAINFFLSKKTISLH